MTNTNAMPKGDLIVAFHSAYSVDIGLDENFFTLPELTAFLMSGEREAPVAFVWRVIPGERVRDVTQDVAAACVTAFMRSEEEEFPDRLRSFLSPAQERMVDDLIDERRAEHSQRSDLEEHGLTMRSVL